MIVRNLDRSGVREGDKEEIRSSFRRFGPVTNVWMADDPPGFAYVFFEAFKDAIKAVESLNETRMCGRRVTAELSPSEDKRKNRGGWATRFGGGRGGGGEGGGGGYWGGDRGGGNGGGFRDNYRPRGRGGFRSYDRDSRDDSHGGRDYDNRGQRSDYRDSSYGNRGRGRGGYNSYRGGGYGHGSRGRGGGSYQQRWGGRGGYGSSGRDDGSRSSFRNSGDNYQSDRGGDGRYYQSGGGGRGRGGYYERDSYDSRRDRREDIDTFSDDGGSVGGHARSKDYEYRESRSYGGGADHKLQEHGREKRYPSSSPEYVKEPPIRSSKYRKRSDGDEFSHRSSSEYRHSHAPPDSTKWEASPYRQQEGSPGSNYNRSRSRSGSPYAVPDYFSPPPQESYRSSRKHLDKPTDSFEHLDEFPPIDETYSASRSFARHTDFSPETAEPVSTEYSDYRERDRDRMVKYGDLPESRGSRHYKSSKRAGSEEPLDHKVQHEMESTSRYIKLDEKSIRSRRSHPRAYRTSREPGEREHRRSSPSRHATPPPLPPIHSKRSVMYCAGLRDVLVSNLIGAHLQHLRLPCL